MASALPAPLREKTVESPQVLRGQTSALMQQEQPSQTEAAALQLLAQLLVTDREWKMIHQVAAQVAAQFAPLALECWLGLNCRGPVILPPERSDEFFRVAEMQVAVGRPEVQCNPIAAGTLLPLWQTLQKR